MSDNFSSDPTSGGQPPIETLTDQIQAMGSNERRSRRPLAIAGSLAVGAALVMTAAGFAVWGSGNEKEKGPQTAPTPLPTPVASSPYEQPTLSAYPETELRRANGGLKLSPESFDPLYEPCHAIGSEAVKQARVEGYPQADEEDYNANRQAVVTVRAGEVRKAKAAGYKHISLAFIPQNEEGSFNRDEAECAADTPDYLPAKNGKVWAASGIGTEDTIFSFVATTPDGETKFLPTKLAKVAKAGDSVVPGSSKGALKIPLY